MFYGDDAHSCYVNYYTFGARCIQWYTHVAVLSEIDIYHLLEL